MNDRILEGYLSAFAKEHNLIELDETALFEHFINYCIVSRIHPENFDFEAVGVGGQNDTSIDGIAILVNEHLITSAEEIDFFKEHLRRLDASFIFIQAKTSASFDMGEIAKFFFGIRDFFENTPRLKASDQIRRMRQLKEYIYDCAIDMDKSPVCHIYYVTTGTWVGDQNLCAVVDREVAALRATNLFSEVQFFPVDEATIKGIYKSIKGKVTKVIEFSKHTILPDMDGVEEAYIGILPCAEYLRLICDEEGAIQRSLFYDNVRDFQGNNPVNIEIAETIKDTSQKDKFVLLNNGITIVSKSITKVGVKFTIRDFQIVNGCQTSHILHRNKQYLSEKLHLPVKLIVTNDLEVTNNVIKATNRQTEVKIEAFEALSPFHKRLEDFYASFDKETDYRLYYERRSKQYDESPINRSRIVSIPGQIKSFLAMFMNEPHSMHRYYGELLMSYKSKIFQENHSLYPYYISSYAWFVLEEMFATRKLLTLYKPWRYHLIMMARLLAEKEELPYLNSKKVEVYCDQLKAVLGNRKTAYAVFETGAQLIDKAVPVATFDPAEARRRKAFTVDLISRVSARMGVSRTKSTGDVEKKCGVVKWFSDTKGYGFILMPDESEVFVHYSGIHGYGWKSLEEGQSVEFSIVQTAKGPVATNVVKVPESRTAVPL